MTENRFQRLLGNDWNYRECVSYSFCRSGITTNPISIFALEKTYNDGLSVTVSVHQQGSHFVVASSAEHRCSGPAESVVGIAVSHDDAVVMAVGSCDEWDSEDV